MKIRPGQVWHSKDGAHSIEIIKRKGGNGHWYTRKLTGRKSHMIHEGTLRKHYEMRGGGGITGMARVASDATGAHMVRACPYCKASTGCPIRRLDTSDYFHCRRCNICFHLQEVAMSDKVNDDGSGYYPQP